MNILNNTLSSDSASTEPVRYCRACGERTATFTQTYEFRGVTIAPATVASTCQEPSCELFLQTLSDDTDLAPYNAVANYDALTGKLIPKWQRCSNVGSHRDTAVSRHERVDIAVRSGK